MTIVQMLKDRNLMTRIPYENRWLVWNSSEKEWWVCKKKPTGIIGKVICRSPDEHTAVDFLLGKRS